MTERTITEKICLEAKYLGPNLLENIQKKIKTKMLGHCDREYGYVIDAGNDIKILDNMISSTSSGVFFVIQFTVRSLKPSIGDVFRGKVTMFIEKGVLLEVENLMKVFVSREKMGKYKYSKSKQMYKKGSSTIEIGSMIDVIISDIAYEKRNFNCIASLKDT